MPTYIENLKTLRDNMALAAKIQSDNWIAAGCPPSFSIDGESYQFNDWLKSLMDGIAALEERIAAGEPFEYVQRAY